MHKHTVSVIKFSVQLKSLGVTLDQGLTFDQHVRNVVKASNFNIRALRHIRPLLTREVANTVACSIVSTRLDYCNSLLYGISQKNIPSFRGFKTHWPGWLPTSAVGASIFIRY